MPQLKVAEESESAQAEGECATPASPHSQSTLFQWPTSTSSSGSWSSTLRSDVLGALPSPQMLARHRLSQSSSRCPTSDGQGSLRSGGSMGSLRSGSSFPSHEGAISPVQPSPRPGTPAVTRRATRRRTEPPLQWTLPEVVALQPESPSRHSSKGALDRPSSKGALLPAVSRGGRKPPPPLSADDLSPAGAAQLAAKGLADSFQRRMLVSLLSPTAVEKIAGEALGPESPCFRRHAQRMRSLPAGLLGSHGFPAVSLGGQAPGAPPQAVEVRRDDEWHEQSSRAELAYAPESSRSAEPEERGTPEDEERDPDENSTTAKRALRSRERRLATAPAVAVDFEEREEPKDEIDENFLTRKMVDLLRRRESRSVTLPAPKVSVKEPSPKAPDTSLAAALGDAFRAKSTEGPTGASSSEEAAPPSTSEPAEPGAAIRPSSRVLPPEDAPLSEDSGWLRLAETAVVVQICEDVGVPLKCLRPALEQFKAHCNVACGGGECVNKIRRGMLSQYGFKAVIRQLTKGGEERTIAAAAAAVFRRADGEEHPGISFAELADWLASRLKRLGPAWQLDSDSLEDFLAESTNFQQQEEDRHISVNFNLNPTDVERYREEFRKFDLDGSGFLNRDEFNNLISVLTKKSVKDLPPTRLTLWWQSADLDNNGRIEFPEFIRFHRHFFVNDGKGTSVVADNYYQCLSRSVKLLQAPSAQTRRRSTRAFTFSAGDVGQAA